MSLREPGAPRIIHTKSGCPVVYYNVVSAELAWIGMVTGLSVLHGRDRSGKYVGDTPC